MNLTKRQVELLESLPRYLAKPPTFPGAIVRHLPSWLLIAVIVLGLGALSLGTSWPLIFWMLLGMWIGCVSRDVGYARKVSERWVIFKEVIAWERVEELLTRTKIGKSAPPPSFSSNSKHT